MNQLLWFALTMIRVNEMRFSSALPSLLVSESFLLPLQVNNQELLHNTNLSAKHPFGHLQHRQRKHWHFEKGEFTHNQCWLWLAALLQLQDANAGCIEMPSHPRPRSIKNKNQAKLPVSCAVNNRGIAQGTGSLVKSGFPSQKKPYQDCICLCVQVYRHRVPLRNEMGEVVWKISKPSLKGIGP